MLSAWPRRRGWFSNMARTTPSPDLGGVPGRVAGRAFDSAGLGLTDRRNDDGVPSQRRGAPVKEIAEGMEAPEHRTTLEAPGGRLAAFGNQLIEVHLWLREELAALREDTDANFAGRARPRDLRAHCLTFCSALSRHHTGEDDGAFPKLAEQFPGLRPVLEELRSDHRLVEDSLQRLQALLDGPGQEMDRVVVRSELDSLAALMESTSSTKRSRSPRRSTR